MSLNPEIITSGGVATVFGLFFGALFVVIGLIVAVVGFKTVRQWHASRRWPHVSARINSCAVKEVLCFAGGDDEQIMFRPEVSYTFMSGGGEVTSHDLAFVSTLYATYEQAQKVIAQYRPGMMVKARYNPENPREAVLVRRGALAGFMLTLLGLFMIALPLFIADRAGLPAGPMGLVLTGMVVVLSLISWLGGRRLSRARRTGLYPAPGKGSDRDVVRLLQQREKMLAIRLYRELHGTDLQMARLKVEEIEKSGI